MVQLATFNLQLATPSGNKLQSADIDLGLEDSNGHNGLPLVELDNLAGLLGVLQPNG